MICNIYHISRLNRRRCLSAVGVALCATFTTPHTWGQALSKEITVDREVVLTHREANRLTTLPKVELPALSKPALKFAYFSGASDITNAITPLPPVNYGDSLPAYDTRGYVSVGYFPLQKVDLSAGYRIIDNDRTRLNVRLQYNRNDYESEMVAGDFRGLPTSRPHYGNLTYPMTLKDNAATIGFDLHRVTGTNSCLEVSAEYTYARYNLPYGLGYAGDNQPADGEMPLIEVPVVMSHNGVNRAGLSIGYLTRNGDWRYSIGGRVRYFGYAEIGQRLMDCVSLTRHYINITHPVREIEGEISGTVENTGGSLTKGLAYSVAVQHDNHSYLLAFDPLGIASPLAMTDNADGRTFGVLSLKPYVGFGNDKIKGTAGIDAEFTFNQGAVFHVAPEVNIGWHPINLLTLQLKATGGVERNTLASLYDLNRYTPADVVYDNSYVPVDAMVTLLVGPRRGLWASAGFGYSIAKDWELPLLVGYVSWLRHDISGWRGSVAAGYNWRDMIEVAASLEVSPAKYNRGYYRNTDRAAQVVDVDLTIHPVRQLTVNASWQLRANRHISHVEKMASGVSRPVLQPLNNLSDLSARASWSFTPRLAAWLSGDNLLGRKWDTLGLFTAQGRTAMVGVTYQF